MRHEETRKADGMAEGGEECKTRMADVIMSMGTNVISRQVVVL